MNSTLINELIDTNDIKVLKECIKNREKLKLSIDQIIEVIKKSNDINFIRKCIFNKKEFDFLSMHIFDIIKDLDDKNFIKECICSNKKLKLQPYMIKYLLEKLEEPEFTKKCIENYEKLEINYFAISGFIKRLKDEKFTVKCIFNKKLNLISSDIKTLIASLKKDENIKKCILNAKKLNLSSDDIEELILLQKDKDFIKKCILNAKKIGLRSDSISKIIASLNDNEYVKKCLKNKTKISLNNNDARYLEILYNNEYSKYLESIDCCLKINLPKEMTIGIEIESIGRSQDAIERLKKKFFPNWVVKDDPTVFSNKKSEQGTEVVSPILYGSNLDDSSEIVKVCTILKNIGNYTNESCGGHIHIGARFLKSIQSWKNLLEIWANTEELLYIISNEKGNLPRKDILTYAVPVSLKLKKSFKNNKILLNNINDIEAFKNKIKNIMGLRYKGINLGNINNWEEKCTIEIRMPNGTISPKGWIYNINLFGGIVKVSEEIANLQSKNKDELTKLEKDKIKLFKKLRKNNLKNSEKLDILLELVIDEQDRGEYIDRFNINSKLLKQKENFRKSLKVGISKKPVKIAKKQKEKIEIEK